MKTPYFVTNRNEYENVLKPLLLEWGYEERLNKSCGYNIIVLNDCNLLGVICNYTDIMQINLHDRYIEPNIYHFLEKAAELMGKEYKPFLGDRDVIWCPTEKLANQVLEIADKLGYEWSSETSFLKYSKWSVYKQETCYYISEGMFGSKQKAVLDGYNIISAEEFINFYKKYLNMEEKRNIAISLEEAKKWYESGNSTLRELALKAYSKEELEYVDFNKIYEIVPHTTPGYYVVPDCEDRKWSVIHKLATIAQYFNSKWPISDAQYFIKGKYENEIQFGKHVGVRYPGIVYFNRQEDLIKAVQLIGKDIKYLFC